MNIQRHTCLSTLIIGCLAFAAPSAVATSAKHVYVETIIAIRHAEKPPDSLGQLSCRGLNRSLELSSVLLSRYGRPAFIFAPDPAVMSTSKHGTFSYVRPLATIEPTAIAAHLPVETQIGLGDIKLLQSELTTRRYWNSVVFVAWEHFYLDRFIKALVGAYGGKPAFVPAWPEDDYDSIFVVQLRRENGRKSVLFRREYEGLNARLSDVCPGPPISATHIGKH